jgi:LCP family protein required for cell wall assembly
MPSMGRRERKAVSEPATLSSGPAPAERRARLRRVLTWIGLGMAVVLVIAAAGGYLLYRHLNGNLAHSAIVKEPGHKDPAPGLGHSENILLMGSDTRDFKGGAKFGGEIAGARSDTTILVHIGEDGQHATLVSIPRDTYAHIPACKTANGESTPQWNKFNVAFTIGGPSCTIALVENLTDLPIDHFVVVNFAGFQRMVDALGGVSVCLTHGIDDPVRINAATGGKIGSGLVIGPGRHTLHGKDALGFVRARYAVGDGSDLGRIKNQQVFLSSMIRKATSTGLILHPFSLYHFLDAATKSIETDPGFGLPQLKNLAGKLHGLKPGKVGLLTVPLSDPNAYVNIGGLQASVVFWDKPRAKALWQALRTDGPLPGTELKPKPSASPGANKLTVPPSAIHVRVLNGTGEIGIAHKVADELSSRGFVIDGVGDAESSSYSTTFIRYGVDKHESSQTLAASVPGSDRQQDASLGSTLELIVGSNYNGTAAVTISSPNPTPTPSLDVVTAAKDRCTA